MIEYDDRYAAHCLLQIIGSYFFGHACILERKKLGLPLWNNASEQS